MKFNQAMQQLFQQYSLNPGDSFPECSDYPIWRKTDAAGRPYWGTGSFCGMERKCVPPDANLSYLEWDGNEVHLSGETMGDTAALLRQMMGILAFWERELTDKYPDTAFWLMASYDDGHDLVDVEDDQPIPTITLRFWTDRGDTSVADVENLDRYAQPVMVVYCKEKDYVNR